MGRIIKTIEIENKPLDIYQSSCLHDPDNDNGRHMCVHGTGYMWIKLGDVWLGCAERSTIKTVRILEELGTFAKIKEYLLPLNGQYDPKA